MCIRDRRKAGRISVSAGTASFRFRVHRPAEFQSCLLYTSDAADERSSVDLGGRRIIKKKTNADQARRPVSNKKRLMTDRNR